MALKTANEATSIAIGSDHAGYPLKEWLIPLLREAGYEVADLGTHATESCDYPDFAEAVAVTVAEGRARFGLLVCGTGQGMAMTANKVAGIRAAAVSDTYSAWGSRAHNNANVLCLGARVVGLGLAEAIVDTWLSTGFAGSRHQRRVDKMMSLDHRS
jgi:ribose 5-phosphate isomerase B